MFVRTDRSPGASRHLKVSGLVGLGLVGLGLVLVSPPSTASAAGSSGPVVHASGQLPADALAMPLTSISCTSETHCVAVGTRLLGDQPTAAIAAVSSDGGAHWASTPQFAEVKDLDAVSCPTARMCVAVGWSLVAHTPTSQQLEQGAAIYVGGAMRSLDGGRRWALVRVPTKGVGVLSGVSAPPRAFAWRSAVLGPTGQAWCS